MIKNWSTINDAFFQPPRTVDEAVDRLLLILNDIEHLAIASLQEEKLIDLHFSLGAAIRNGFGRHMPGSELLAACGIGVHPDDASGVIIMALWKRLQSGNV